MSNVLVTREIFEMWLELVDGATYMTPNYNRSKIRATGEFFNEETGTTIEWTIKATAINRGPSGQDYYGRRDTWNLVQVADYWGEAFHLKGKGSRATSTWEMVEEIHALLINS